MSLLFFLCTTKIFKMADFESKYRVFHTFSQLFSVEASLHYATSLFTNYKEKALKI